MMLNIPGYHISEQIDLGANTIVYRGVKENTPVILKVLKDEYPTVEAIARLKHEHSVAQALEHDNIVKLLTLLNCQKRLILVFEDFGGISLKDYKKQYLKDAKLLLSQFISIALQLTQALIYLHGRGIIHKDIKPANIIINPTTGKVKLTDFSIASNLEKEVTFLNNPSQIEGTLAYMSPEQTGRMNRNLDYRSDFYSLGATFYELITGQLPFVNTNVMELVHAHVALEPKPVQELNPDIPDVLGAIITKLMAKNAEDRYQSAKGLLADLEQLTSSNTHFTPGAVDRSSQLRVSQKLYGRSQQVEQLLKAFEQTANGKSQLVLVSGYSGIGKTSVINEINKPITACRGYFISGKFDQFKRDIPYASVIQALSSLIRQLLTENTAQIQTWKNKILAAVGSNGKVITDIISEVQLIIGEQPEIPQLSPTEAQNRFNLVFQQFIKVFCRTEHPLVIFLDDLQWADSASLKLIESLISDLDSKHLLIVGAYRDNEVNATHPLFNTIEAIEKAGVTVNNIVLQPLSLDNVCQLISETLNNHTNQTYQLADLIFNKTGGNPFFIIQVLQVLYQEGFLNFNFNTQAWYWSIADIQAIGITDKSVVELVAYRLHKLPESTQKVLKLAACIGDKFTLDVLSIVNEQSASETATELYPALQAGLIVPLNEAYRIPLIFQAEELKEQVKLFDTKLVSYKFLHDRVQQAAYSLIPDSQKKTTHLAIGQLLKQSTPPEQLTQNILDIVNQINFGIELLNQTDKDELAQLNLIAGKKAKASSAYQAASRYFNTGLSLLVTNSWLRDYELTLNLNVEAAESLYLTSNFEQSRKLVDITLKQAKTTLDKVRIYQIKIQACIAQNIVAEAVDTCVKVLQLLGVRLPNKPTMQHLLLSVLRTKVILFRKRIEDLVNLPKMTNSNKLAAMKILMQIIPAADQVGSLYSPLAILAMVRLSIKYGNSPQAAFAYSIYGAMLCDKLGDIESGYKFGKLGKEVLELFNDKSIKCKIDYIFNSLIRHFKEPAARAVSSLQETVQDALVVGDIEFAGYSAWTFSIFQLLMVNDLKLLESSSAKFIQLLQTLKLEPMTLAISLSRQTALNLQSQSLNTKLLEFEDEPAKVIEYLGNNFAWLSVYYGCKTILNYFAYNYEKAIETAILTKGYLDKMPKYLMYPVVNFYHSLSLLALFNQITPKTRASYLKQVANNQKKMRKWAHHAACNYQHKYDLVEAEKAFCLDKNYLAAEFYDKAIAGAKTHGYINEFALANELAAKFYISLGKQNIAKTYITDAYYAYIEWGAIAKVRDLEKRYDSLIIRSLVPKSGIDITGTISTSVTSRTKSTSNTTQLLDLPSIMKASEVIQADISVESLPSTLLRIALKNAGACKGSILLEKDGQLFVEAIDTLDEHTNSILQSIAVEQSQDIPQKIINYVQRTQQPLVIGNATVDLLSSSDPYVKLNKSKSILCVPIIYQGEQIGIIYLENNLATNAFTEARLELVKILASQTAIALKNARLFLQEQEKSQMLSVSLQQLEEALTQLQQTQTQLVHTEKISALGQLVAGVAHEVNNPVGFIGNNLQIANQYVEDLVHHLALYRQHYPNPVDSIVEDAENIDLEYLLEDLPKMLSSMKLGTVRIKEIMQSLRSFSRNDGAHKRTADIHEGINSTLLILGHRLKADSTRPAIQIIKDYGDLPLVNCYPGALNQVFMNLLANAIDAMEEGNIGKTYQEIELNPNIITIRTYVEDDMVVVRIKDNGLGMNEQTRALLFDAFFTTKPSGKGTGLGLSISYKIITEQHGGKLEVITAPLTGAEFVIKIPHQ